LLFIEKFENNNLQMKRQMNFSMIIMTSFWGSLEIFYSDGMIFFYLQKT